MATIYEVSERAGVSLATVSRVINNTGKVSEKTKTKVLNAMQELGYRPNAMARSLASNRTNSVGILVPDLKGSFFGHLMEGIESSLNVENKHVIITTGHSDAIKEKEGIEFLLSRNCDALILHVEAFADEELLELNKGKVPIFVVNRLVKGMEDKCIYLDNKIGGYLAAKSVLGKGHTDIAYITGHTWKADSNDRLYGHKAALEEAGVEFDEDLLYVGNYMQDGGSQGLTELLHRGKPFSALICANDETAAGAMAMARKLGLNLPKDLSIVGFDNLVYASYLYPTLSTINYPVLQIGQMAATMVLRDVYEKKDLSVKHAFSPKLVERNSVFDLR